ncbi:GIY-YIG nuclease family protein [Patescibacteria group bacterium]|nr:GIY-YIG nuclease family protein [Patescibacteria group bacterium]MBU4026738.1 GIY-YIG nuclease family protein [Patescibacteria group bacterium]MBU4073049.1 GIY-YIG nuclease family protein [Patescibacteria group bacterium]MBU4102868.1 GIY-YIG nuclease family protein [Patescibacteria group bacterium]
MNLAEIKKKFDFSNGPGIYKFLNQKGKIIYIGKAANLSGRVLSYWSKSARHTPAKYSMLKQVDDIQCVETDSEIEALLLEANLIKKHQPRYNIALRDGKRYTYIKVSTEEEIPGVFIVRKIDKSGRYFGPFVSAAAVRETLKAIRKIWPYCAAKKRQPKPCFYYQINRCLGICAVLISRKEYMEKVIRPIILFFEGKKDKVIKNYELRIRNYELGIKKYKAGSEKHNEVKRKISGLKLQLFNIKKVLENASIIGLEEKYAADLAELAKILRLPKAPQRIEGYDISNIFGQQAVGSMAVFSGGEPDKKEYRKFKIKTAKGRMDDVKMLKEVLTRRIKRAHAAKHGLHSKTSAKEWPLPDLIIVDGGKQQLNAALQVFKKFKISDKPRTKGVASRRHYTTDRDRLSNHPTSPSAKNFWRLASSEAFFVRGKDIAVIAISKGLGLRSSNAPDKIFFPGEKKPLELPLASPAPHLIKRVRDEAHRFAIGYHRKLRSKKFLNKN